MSEETQRCGNCRFFRADPIESCHRNPPLGHAFIVPQQNVLTGKPELRPQTLGYWPIVQPQQWCGEWQAPASALDS